MCPKERTLNFKDIHIKRAQYLQKKGCFFCVYHSETLVSLHIAIMGRLSQNRGLCHDLICDGKTVIA